MTASGTPAPGRAGRREQLTAERIVDGVLHLIERDGLAALSMRRLGTLLGVEAMSLYHYFASKDELLDAAVAQVLGEMSEPPEGTTWEARFRGHLRRYRRIAHDRPQLFPLIGRRRVRRNGQRAELVPAEWLLDDLVGAGFGPDDALVVFQSLIAYTHGFALMEISRVVLDVRDVDAAEFPRLHELAPHLARRDLDADFERGLDLLLEGARGLIRSPG